MKKTIESRVKIIEDTIILQRGQIEILIGFIVSKLNKNDFEEFLKIVSESNQFTPAAKVVANEYLRQSNLWGECSLPSTMKQ